MCIGDSNSISIFYNLYKTLPEQFGFALEPVNQCVFSLDSFARRSVKSLSTDRLMFVRQILGAVASFKFTRITRFRSVYCEHSYSEY